MSPLHPMAHPGVHFTRPLPSPRIPGPFQLSAQPNTGTSDGFPSRKRRTMSESDEVSLRFALCPGYCAENQHQPAAADRSSRPRPPAVQTLLVPKVWFSDLRRTGILVFQGSFRALAQLAGTRRPATRNGWGVGRRWAGGGSPSIDGMPPSWSIDSGQELYLGNTRLF